MLLGANNVDDCLQNFYDFLRAMSVTHVSFMTMTSKIKPWINPFVIHLIDKRSRLRIVQPLEGKSEIKNY